jgi:glutamate dehydrogenase/leucine dehydrogenase
MTPEVAAIFEGQETLGWIVMDSFVAGRACGGVRMLPDVSENELRVLARAMTLKFGLLRLPQGGAKAGIIGDPEAPANVRQERIVRYAQAAGKMLRDRRFVPGPDVGTTNEDIRAMLRAAGIEPSARELRGTRSGYYTAVGVFAAMKAAVRFRGMRLEGSSLAIEGLGKVGSELARLALDAGMRIVAASTSRGAIYDPAGLNGERLLGLAKQYGSGATARYTGARAIALQELLEVETDVLVPCARLDSIHESNAGRLRCSIVCPGANAPVTAAAERILTSRGIMSVPDFVANSGGVLGGTMEFAGASERTVASFVDQRLERFMAWLLEQGSEPRSLAERIALRGHERVRLAATRRRFAPRLLELGVRVYRRGGLPPSLIGRLSHLYFRNVLSPEAVCQDL